MDKVYVNEYEYTEEIADEAQKAFLRQNRSMRLNMIVSVVLIMYGFFMLLRGGGWFYLIIILLGGGFMVYMMVMQKKIVKQEMEQLDEIFRGAKTKLIHYELDDELRTYLDDDDEPSYIVERRDMVGWTESANLIILLCRGRAFVPFKKGSFIEGNEDELRNYLKGMFAKSQMGSKR